MYEIPLGFGGAEQRGSKGVMYLLHGKVEEDLDRKIMAPPIPAAWRRSSVSPWTSEDPSFTHSPELGPLWFKIVSKEFCRYGVHLVHRSETLQKIYGLVSYPTIS